MSDTNERRRMTGERRITAHDLLTACGQCDWCTGAARKCPHGFACCRNCPTCNPGRWPIPAPSSSAPGGSNG